MPGLKVNGTWISLVQTTIDEVYDYWTDDCGGGIYWVHQLSDLLRSLRLTNLVHRSHSVSNLQIGDNSARIHLTGIPGVSHDRE